MDKKLMVVTFAGGCFWCLQPPFQQIEGVTGAGHGMNSISQKGNIPLKRVSF
jgi:peptide methionine sulfoxide reductase MsrA